MRSVLVSATNVVSVQSKALTPVASLVRIHQIQRLLSGQARQVPVSVDNDKILGTHILKVPLAESMNRGLANPDESVKLRHSIHPLAHASPVVVPTPESFVLASQFGQLGTDALRRPVKQRPEVVFAGRESAIRSRNVNEHIRVNRVVVEGNYQLGGMVGQKVLGDIHVVAVSQADDRMSLTVILSNIIYHGNHFLNRSVMGMFRRALHLTKLLRL